MLILLLRVPLKRSWPFQEIAFWNRWQRSRSFRFAALVLEQAPTMAPIKIISFPGIRGRAEVGERRGLRRAPLPGARVCVARPRGLTSRQLAQRRHSLSIRAPPRAPNTSRRRAQQLSCSLSLSRAHARSLAPLRHQTQYPKTKPNQTKTKPKLKRSSSSSASTRGWSGCTRTSTLAR